MSKPGLLFVVAAPSGAGKTSLVKALTEANEEIVVSISHTTRPIRPGEETGKNYHFVSQTEFYDMVSKDAFIEHANVFGHHYGTSKKSLSQQLQSGLDVILEIDWQGAAQVRELYENVTSIFILPPSLEALEARLRRRGQDDEQTIARRMAEAKAEMSHYKEFDFLIINEDFTEALSDLTAIVQAAHLRFQEVSASKNDLLQRLLA